MNKFKSISEIMDQEKQFAKFKTAIDGYTVVDEFYNVFPELKKIAKAKKFESNILFLYVENSVWRSELNINKEIMISKINKFFGKKIIKNIKFI